MNDLRVFRLAAKRIRHLRAWRAAAAGLFAGALIAAALAMADWQRWLWFEWIWLAPLPIIGFLAGWAAGWLRRLDEKTVAASLDHRAGLQDRVSTSLELGGEHPFAGEVASDAKASLERIDPTKLYPLRFSKWHSLAVACLAVAAGIVLLGNTPLLKSPGERQEQEELKGKAEEIEKIVRPVLDEKGLPKPTEDYAKQLEQFARELERSRHDKKDALKKTNDLLSQGQELQKQLENQMNSNLDQAQRSIEKMLGERLAEKSMEATPEEIREQVQAMLDSASPAYQQALEQGREERNSLQSQKRDLQSQIEELKRQIRQSALNSAEQKAMEEMLRELQAKQKEVDEGLKALAEEMKALDQAFREQMDKPLSEAGEFEKQMAELRKELNAIQNKLKAPNLTKEQREALQKKAEAMRELMKKLQMSEELRQGLKDLYADPQMKEIMKRMAELMAKAKFAENSDGEPGEPPKLTEEEIAELQKMLDELGKQLSDPKFREEMLKAMKEALDNMDQLTLSQGMCMGLGMCMLPGFPTPVGAPVHGGSFSDTNWVNKLEKGEKGGGKTLPARVTGERHPTLGKESFVETRGPARLGQPSKVPYLKILPKYQQALEEALKKQQIPKDQEKRVRDYFRSIGGQ